MALIPFLIAAVLGLYAWYRYSQAKEARRMPEGARRLPGPRPWPIVGRIHDVPAETAWLKFYEWSKEFGPIYQHDMFGSVHVWISSERIAHELLSRRAAIYSDRPQIPNLPDNRTSGNYLALSGRNDTWRRQRKLCAQLMSTSHQGSLHGYPTRERDRFLYLMWQDPSQYREWIEQFTGRTVSRLSWGSAHPSDVLRETTFGLLETISPSGALPNVISWLMHVPRFMSPWKQKEAARHAREAVMLSESVKFVSDGLEKGTAEPSFVRTYLDSLIPRSSKEGGVSDDTEKAKNREKWGDTAEATYVVGQMAIAGALTIGSPIQSFLLAMLHYPDWQSKLQDEIDRVCDGQCPQWEDREKLPMLRAFVKEVIRWRPPVPTGIPHAIEEDDVYEGYFIPAGATIHALEWAITRDEKTYPDAETFNPGRWLDPSYPTYKEPLTLHPNLNGFSQFGFGRRTCQGVPIVDQDLFLAMGGMAWAFKISKKRRPDGTEVPVHWNDYTPLLIAKPSPFEFDLQVRTGSSGAGGVIEKAKKEFILRQMWESGKGEDDEALERARAEAAEAEEAERIRRMEQQQKMAEEEEHDRRLNMVAPPPMPTSELLGGTHHGHQHASANGSKLGDDGSSKITIMEKTAAAFTDSCSDRGSDTSKDSAALSAGSSNSGHAAPVGVSYGEYLDLE